MTSPLKPLGQYCSNFKWSLLGAGERKIAKIVDTIAKIVERLLK